LAQVLTAHPLRAEEVKLVGVRVKEPELSPQLSMPAAEAEAADVKTIVREGCDNHPNNKKAPDVQSRAIAPRLRWWAENPSADSRDPSNRGTRRAQQIYSNRVDSARREPPCKPFNDNDLREQCIDCEDDA
jgi:hypothetical protein